MTETINGLLTQKASSPPPTVGEVKIFAWENRTSKAGKPWIKIKNETPEYGGKPCRIIQVQQTDFQDAHGNLSFNLEIEPTTDGFKATPTNYQKAAPAHQDAPQRAAAGSVIPIRHPAEAVALTQQYGPTIEELTAQSGKVFAAGWAEAEQWIKLLPVKDLEAMSLECYYDLWMRAAQHIAIDTGKTIRKERF